MSDRALLFLFGVLVIIVCLGTCGALLMNGQAETVDGLFLILMCLAIALAFGLYLMFMIRRAMEPPPPPPKPAPKPAAAFAAPLAQGPATSSAPPRPQARRGESRAGGSNASGVV